MFTLHASYPVQAPEEGDTQAGGGGGGDDVDDLHGDIAAAMDAVDGTDTQAGATDGDTQPGGTGDDTLAGDDTQPGGQGDDTQAGASSTDGAPLEAPQHWPAADRETFAKLPKEGQQFLLRRHTDLERDYTRKTEAIAPARRLKENIDELFKPFKREMELQGTDEVAAIKQLVAAHKYLLDEPQKAIFWLAGNYGIDLKKAMEGEANKTPEQRIAEAEQRMTQRLEQTLHQSTSVRQQESINANLAAIEKFADEKDAQGKLMRPHFNDVAPLITRLIRAAKSEGQTLSLQDAYDQATYADPKTRDKVLSAKSAEQQRKDQAERKRKADAARRAGFKVEGEGAAAAGTSRGSDHGSITADLGQAWDAQVGKRI